MPHNSYLMEYTGGEILPGGSGSHGELLDRRWVPREEVTSYDLAFESAEKDNLRRLDAWRETGELPEVIPTERASIEATPTGNVVTNEFSEVAAQSTATAQAIPIGVGTRMRTADGIRSLSFTTRIHAILRLRKSVKSRLRPQSSGHAIRLAAIVCRTSSRTS